jgi:hypothetical protein
VELNLKKTKQNNEIQNAGGRYGRHFVDRRPRNIKRE